MKKYLSLLVVLMLVLVGCGKNNASTANEKEALEAYVATVNKINEKKSYDLGMNGTIEIPKSTLNKTEVKGNISLNGYADDEIKMDIEMDVDINGQKMPMKMLSDGKFLYMQVDGSWQKMKIDEKALEEANPAKATTYEDAKKMFAEYKDTKYEKVKVDGQDGYKITYTMDFASLTKALEKTDSSAEQDAAMEAIKGMAIKGELIVPTKPNNKLDLNIKFNMDIMGIEMKFDADLKLSGADKKKIEIPKAAKDAVETNSNNINNIV